MENTFKSFIDQSNSILILLPSKPNFDQVAAGLSLYLALKNNKSVSIACPAQMTVEFNRLVGVNRITQELGNKNLLIKFGDYKANDIERVSYDIEDKEFRLTVIPKTGIAAPAKEQVDISYSGVSSDTVIMVGGMNESHFPALSSKELAGAKIVHVGTKQFNVTSKISVMSFAKPASSVSEMVAALILDSGLIPDGDVATNLLMGIEDGSTKYTSPNVTSDTFLLISELMRAGGMRQDKAAPPKTYPAGAIPGGIPTQSGPTGYQSPAQMQPLQSQAQPLQTQMPLSRPQPQPNFGGMPQPLVQTQPQFQPQPGISSMTSEVQTPPLSTVESAPEQNMHAKGDDADKQDEQGDDVPQDWLKPRIYKGTSVS